MRGKKDRKSEAKNKAIDILSLYASALKQQHHKQAVRRTNTDKKKEEWDNDNKSYEGR